MKFFEKYGWVIDYLAMAFMVFIVGIALTIYVVPPDYDLIALSFTLIFTIIIPFMVYSHDESGVQESQVIALLARIIRKLLFISKSPEPKQTEQILARKTFLARKI